MTRLPLPFPLPFPLTSPKPFPRFYLSLAAVVAGLGATTIAGAAGSVEVKFIDPANYTDTGLHAWDRERALQDLQAHLLALGSRLPDGQTLRIEVLDVDLAGEIRYGTGQDWRVLRGGVDWPQMRLRYTLQAGGQTLAQGEERLSDPAYLFSHRLVHKYSFLPYERRMLDDWFGQRFPSLR